MYIYLDESYNLKDRDKKQFISINGFMVLDVAKLRKKWLKARKPYTGKKRIHAHNATFDPLRKKALEILKNSQIYLISVFQEIKLIPNKQENRYWKNNNLDFEKIYLDLSKKLLFSLKLNEYREVIISIDNRKNKAGMIGKNLFRDTLAKKLKTAYPEIIIKKPRLIPTSSDVLLELADFVSNSFYRFYQNDEKGELTKYMIKTQKIKNPL